MQSNELVEKILNLTREYYKEKFENYKFIPGTSTVRYAGRVFDENEIVHLVESSLEFWLTAGHNAEKFENELADFLSLSDAILVNSGSSANLVAFSTLTSPKLMDRRIKPGDEVITVAAGFPTTVAPIIQNGAVPVFVDVELETYNANVGKIEEVITKNTKAIMLAHTLGNPFNLEQVVDICKKHNLWLIEDNCDALGSKYKDQYTGTFGDLATISFYPAHHITMGEGGAVITNNDELAKIARSFRDWGRDCYCASGEDNTCGVRFTQQFGKLPVGYDHKFVYSHLGYNLKVTDMQAAVGLEQLKKLPSFISRRKENYNILYQGLKKYSDLFYLPKATEMSDPSWFGFLISVKENSSFSRNDLVNFLNINKIHTRNLFAGNLTKQPALENVKFKVHDELINTDYIMENTFFIGVYPGLGQEELGYVINKFEEFINNAGTKKN